jgi:hypothetical protein
MKSENPCLNYYCMLQRTARAQHTSGSLLNIFDKLHPLHWFILKTLFLKLV